MSARWTFQEHEVQTLRDCLDFVAARCDHRLGYTQTDPVDTAALRHLRRAVKDLRSRLFPAQSTSTKAVA